MSSRAVQQHFITAALLAGFTDDGERQTKLYVYERNEERVLRMAPDEAGKQRNYNSIPLEGGGYNDSFDQMLTALEGQAIPILRKLIDREYKITTLERSLLAYLIAFQEMRTPWARKMLNELHGFTMARVMERYCKTPGALENVLQKVCEEKKVVQKVSADELRAAIKNKRIKLEVQPHASIEAIAAVAPRVGDIYTQFRWVVLRAAGKASFVTSDAPVVRTDPRPGGLFTSTVQIWFPISKECCLLMKPDNSRVDRIMELSEAGKIEEAEALLSALPQISELKLSNDRVEGINVQTVLNADRWVYSAVESPLVTKYFKGECRNMRLSVSPKPEGTFEVRKR